MTPTLGYTKWRILVIPDDESKTFNIHFEYKTDDGVKHSIACDKWPLIEACSEILELEELGYEQERGPNWEE